MANSGIYEEDYTADDNDSLLVASDSGVETETLPDQDRDEGDLDVDGFDSPSDGYFTDRRHPQHTFVQGSSVQAEADRKAREASSTDPSSPAPPTRSASVSDAGPAPPDYAAATAHQHVPAASQIYSTSLPPTQALPTQRDNSLYWPFGSRSPFSVLHEHQHPPQTMSDRHPDEETGLLRQRKKRKRSRLFGCCIKMVVVALVIVAIVVASQVLNGSNESDMPGDDEADPFLPIPSPPDAIQPSLPIPSPSRICPYSSYSSSVAFDFPSPASFSFLELLERNEHFSGRIGGSIWIKPADSSQDVNVRVWIQYATTDPWQVSGVNYVQTDTSLELKFPEMRNDGLDSRRKPCLHIGVVIQVREDTVVEDWDVATENLAVKLDEALFYHTTADAGFRITKSSSISTRSGDVEGYWSSRRTKIDTTSGSITGTYALEDLLSIHSSSGAVDIAIDPKEADPEKPAPAEFVAVTSSGSIKTRVRTSPKLPVRDYQTRVQTNSASISGDYVHGSTTSFSSLSGSIKVEVLPIASYLLIPDTPSMAAQRAWTSTLRTDTNSGETLLRLLSPFPNDDDAFSPPWNLDSNNSISAMRSTHKSASGSITLTYPDEWTGDIEGESMSGHISVRGKDVQILLDKQQRFRWLAHLIARKGKGKSRLGIATTSGSVDVLVGRE